MALCQHVTILFSCAVATGLLAAPAHAQDASKLTSIVDWSLYTDSEKPHAFCFLTSTPKSANASSAGARIYISAWPKEGVKAEPSVRLGFATKKGSEITAAIGAQSFTLFADKERAYVADATSELKLVEAMRKGSKLAVTATDPSGTSVTDTYSLAGLGQAMQELQSTCF